MHRTHQQSLPSSFLHKAVFGQGSNVFLGTRGDFWALPAGTVGPTSEENDVERVPATNALAAPSSPLANSIVSYDEIPTDPAASDPLSFSFLSGPTTAIIIFSQRKIFTLPVASELDVSSVPVSNVLLPTLTTILFELNLHRVRLSPHCLVLQRWIPHLVTRCRPLVIYFSFFVNISLNAMPSFLC